MPGLKDIFHPFADWMTPFVLHRTVAADDVSPDAVAQTISFSASVTAHRNKLFLIAKRTAGAGNIKAELYMQVPVNGLDTSWVLVSSVSVNTLELNRFDDLYAARYRIVFTRSDPAATFEIYESRTDINRP